MAPRLGARELSATQSASSASLRSGTSAAVARTGTMFFGRRWRNNSCNNVSCWAVGALPSSWCMWRWSCDGQLSLISVVVRSCWSLLCLDSHLRKMIAVVNVLKGLVASGNLMTSANSSAMDRRTPDGGIWSVGWLCAAGGSALDLLEPGTRALGPRWQQVDVLERAQRSAAVLAVLVDIVTGRKVGLAGGIHGGVLELCVRCRVTRRS